MITRIFGCGILLFFYAAVAAQRINTPVPSSQQLAWHQLEYYWFIHFGPNTFTDKEWGHGDEPEDLFNPEKLDCRQWARIAKQSGAMGIIITAKHHDGFCLWPSKYSTHTVRESKWKGGKGDVLEELSQACKEYGLKFGVYLSPWDRNHPAYGTENYNDVYVNTMKELVSRYGPFFEFWWDGANGEGPNGKKQVYDFRRFENTIREIAPETVVFSDIGPDIRWVGNEKGIAGKTNWNYLDTAGFKRGLGAPPNDTLSQGNVFGKNWIPAECDVSIRPGWFYHPDEDAKTKTGKQLFDIYLKSVGRGSNLLLNIPPNRNGLISPEDSSSLVEFKKLRDISFSKNLSGKSNCYSLVENSKQSAKELVDGNKNSGINIPQPAMTSVIIDYNVSIEMNCIVLQEDILKGQHCGKFKITLTNNGKLEKEIYGTTIGNKRILSFPKVSADHLVITFENAGTPIGLNEIGSYLIDEQLIEQQER